MWEDSLVDPDNRRPIDFSVRARILAELDAAAGPPAIDDVGRAKLWLVSRALRLRRARPDLFVGYHPLLAGWCYAAGALVVLAVELAPAVATTAPAPEPSVGDGAGP